MLNLLLTGVSRSLLTEYPVIPDGEEHSQLGHECTVFVQYVLLYSGLSGVHLIESR